MVLSSHRESVRVLNSEEKHPRGARKTKEMGLTLGRDLWLSSNTTCAREASPVSRQLAASFPGLQCPPL